MKAEKYEVRGEGRWNGFAVLPSPKGHPVKVVDAADLKDGDKPLPDEVRDLLVRRKVLVPVAGTEADEPEKE